MLVSDGLNPQGTEVHVCPVLGHGMLPVQELRPERPLLSRSFAVRRSSGQVVVFCILTHGAIGGKTWSQARHALPHARHPPSGNASGITGVKRRNHFLFYYGIQGLSLSRVPGWIIVMFL